MKMGSLKPKVRSTTMDNKLNYCQICFLILVPLLLSFSCNKKIAQASVSEGLNGKVLWFEGNLMPGPGAPVNTGTPVEREILIYKLTKESETEKQEMLYSEINTELAATVNSDENGNFAISLPPGSYSLFTKEEGGLFANSYDGAMNIHPVVVKPGEVTSTEIQINYKAVY